MYELTYYVQDCGLVRRTLSSDEITEALRQASAVRVPRSELRVSLIDDSGSTCDFQV